MMYRPFEFTVKGVGSAWGDGRSVCAGKRCF